MVAISANPTGQPWPRSVTIRLRLPRGDAQTDWTAAVMAAMTRHATTTGYVAQIVERLDDLRTGPRSVAPDVPDALLAIYDVCRDRVRFRRDPDRVELTRHPDQMAVEIAERGFTVGDCDELATLAATMIALVGFRPKFVVIGKNPSGPFQHVFPAAALRGRLWALDPQEGVRPGRELPAARRRVYDALLPPQGTRG